MNTQAKRHKNILLFYRAAKGQVTSPPFLTKIQTYAQRTALKVSEVQI